MANVKKRKVKSVQSLYKAVLRRKWEAITTTVVDAILAVLVWKAWNMAAMWKSCVIYRKKDKVMLELKSLTDKQWSKDTEASQWENEQRENEVYKYYTCKMQSVW